MAYLGRPTREEHTPAVDDERYPKTRLDPVRIPSENDDDGDGEAELDSELTGSDGGEGGQRGG